MKTSILAKIARLSSAERSELSAFVLAVLLLVSGFLLAGGARDDIVSLLIWRPLSALLMVVAIVFYGAEAWRRGKALILLMFAAIALVALHLVPMPPSIWTDLPGRDIIVGVYRAAGMDLPWQPLSMAQARTWNALFSLAAPLAMLIIALVLPTRRHKHLLYVILGLGFASGIIGLVQAIGPTSGPLYFYRITNNGMSVGFFANRNHQAAAIATLLPLLAASLSLFRGKPDRLFFHRTLTIAFAALAIPLILMTGSRAGIVLLVCGAGLAWWVYRTPQAEGRVVGVRSEHRTRLVGLGIAVIMLVGIAIIAIRTPALARLMETDPSSELRFQALPTVIADAWKYLPVGSGLGTFVETYQISEPDRLISTRYFNHAHNDYMELYLTGGLPALVLLVWALVLGAIAFVFLLRRRQAKLGEPDFAPQVIGRAGFAALAILALASATDYPLRVPSLMLYAAVAAVWCLNAVKAPRKLHTV